jgi:hypothetical protein
MHPIIVQSIAAEHARDLRQTAKHNHDASVARDRRLRQRRTLRATGAVRLLPAALRPHMS